MTEKIIQITIFLTSNQIENKEFICNQCQKEFTNEQSLKKHFALHHTKGIEKSSKIIYQYSCPITTCKRNINKDYFPSRKYLIQHFFKSHNTEKFLCGKDCGKKFSTELLMNIHMKSCGQIFTCDYCNCSYNSNEALITHRKRKNHFEQGVEINKKKKKKVETNSKSVGTNTNLREGTTISKSTTTEDVFFSQAVQKVTSSTSTAEDFMKEENSNSLSSSSSQKKALTWNARNVYEEDSITIFDSTETQTDLTESFFSNNFMNSFTQTTFADFEDFGTQTNWEEF